MIFKRIQIDEWSFVDELGSEVFDFFINSIISDICWQADVLFLFELKEMIIFSDKDIFYYLW